MSAPSSASRRVRKAVFPVAGLGTRFLPATKTVPKEMLVSETANHSEIPEVEGPRYYEAVTRFARGTLE